LSHRATVTSWSGIGKMPPCPDKLSFRQENETPSLDYPMQLPSSLSWLLDEASAVSSADQFLTALGARLAADGLPLAGGALTLSAPHPIIARRTWLWQAENGTVIEAVGFGMLGELGPQSGNVGRDWLNRLGTGIVEEIVIGATSDDPLIAWAFTRSLTETESSLLRQAARFASAPLSALVTRTTLAALLETYLGRRSAGQVLKGRLRRAEGETIRAVLLYGDLRGFTELSEVTEPAAVIAALDAWFDRIAGAVHAFGGEVLKFIGDGVLAIFPVGDGPPAMACDAALRAVAAARAGMAHLDDERVKQGLPPLPFGMAVHLGDMLWGNIGTADRLDFTAIGPAVNLVGRLEGLCKTLGHNVLISSAVARETTTPLIPLGTHRLRGIAAPCEVFALRGSDN
jgi:adenylate cyclase